MLQLRCRDSRPGFFLLVHHVGIGSYRLLFSGEMPELFPIARRTALPSSLGLVCPLALLICHLKEKNVRIWTMIGADARQRSRPFTYRKRHRGKNAFN